MSLYLSLFILLPLTGFLISLIMPASSENMVSRITFTTAGVQHLLAMVFVSYWIYEGHPVLNIKEFVIYQAGGYEFFIDLYFDNITAVYLVVGSLLTFMITIYSRYYLHREDGYKRFFNTVLFFYLGFNIIILAGNLETLLIGWEVLGISSFLLIAFYRDRYLPVRNAFKVFCLYRIGDICMILAMWMSHHLWHYNVTFLELNNYTRVEEELSGHLAMGLFISFMILITAMVKSAQLPFSSWLPRAMEGPTPSSAIFYSSLSVHIGVFILLRTFPFWEHQMAFRVLVGVIGGLTSVVTTFSSRVQSSVKSQIAYSSIAQIGLIFIEVACGLEVIALIHFAGNAFLRTYQLLVSPSAVTYLIREQLYSGVSVVPRDPPTWMKKWRYSVYVLSVKEWNLDTSMFHYLWNPLKLAGKRLTFLTTRRGIFFLLLVYLMGIGVLLFPAGFPDFLSQVFTSCFTFTGLLLVIRAVFERKRMRLSWMLIVFSHMWIALAVSFNGPLNVVHVGIYLSGVITSGTMGWLVLVRLKRVDELPDLNRFYGHVYEHPVLAFLFLLACLGLAGFPITTTFLGEDLIYTHIHQDQFLLALLVSLSMIIGGLALIRMYARVFLGPHVKTYHPIAHRSS